MKRDTFEIRVKGKAIGTVKAKDLYCAARQARKKFWPKDSSTFQFAVSRLRDGDTLITATN